MGLRGYGQHDPVVEYRIEGFAMFDEMIASIREDAVHMLLTIEIRQQNAQPKREQIAQPTGEGAPAKAGAKGSAPVRVTKIGRNDPCPCGSGLKWKNVHLQGVPPRPVNRSFQRAAVRRRAFCNTRYLYESTYRSRPPLRPAVAL